MEIMQIKIFLIHFFFHSFAPFYTGTQACRSPYLIHYLFLCTYFAEQRHWNCGSGSPAQALRAVTATWRGAEASRTRFTRNNLGTREFPSCQRANGVTLQSFSLGNQGKNHSRYFWMNPLGLHNSASTSKNPVCLFSLPEEVATSSKNPAQALLVPPKPSPKICLFQIFEIWNQTYFGFSKGSIFSIKKIIMFQSATPTTKLFIAVVVKSLYLV